MSILSSTNSGRKLAPITAGILEELGWVFDVYKKHWTHYEYMNVEIYQETSFRKEAKEKRGRIPGNWYAREYIYPTIIDIYSSFSDPKIKIIPLNSIGDLDLLENHKVVKTYSI
jgi:hypothetical protein